MYRDIRTGISNEELQFDLIAVEENTKEENSAVVRMLNTIISYLLWRCVRIQLLWHTSSCRWSFYMSVGIFLPSFLRSSATIH
jgi:hypothetical protein